MAAAPAADRHPRRADHVERRPAQRAAARARPGAVPAREPLRPSPFRLTRHAAGRARRAARPARRHDGRWIAGLEHGEGALYVRLDYADVAAWREWLPLPCRSSRGKGALRALVRFRRRAAARRHRRSGARRRQTRLEPQPAGARARPPRGPRSAGSTTIGSASLSCARRSRSHRRRRNAAADRLHAGARRRRGWRRTGGRLAFDASSSRRWRQLAEHLPLPERVRARSRHVSRRAAPSWMASSVGGPGGGADAPLPRRRVRAASASPRRSLPGADGVTGSFDATEARGRLKLVSRGMQRSRCRASSPIRWRSNR